MEWTHTNLKPNGHLYENIKLQKFITFVPVIFKIYMIYCKNKKVSCHNTFKLIPCVCTILYVCGWIRVNYELIGKLNIGHVGNIVAPYKAVAPPPPPPPLPSPPTGSP